MPPQTPSTSQDTQARRDALKQVILEDRFVIQEERDGDVVVLKIEPPVTAAYREFGLTPISSEADLEAEIGPLGDYDTEG